MRGLWTAIADRLAHREPATPLALFRIACGLSILYTLVPMISADVVSMVWMDRPYGGYRDLEADQWLLRALGGPTDAAVTVLVGLGIASALLLLVGLGSRITPLVAGQVMIALFDINPESGGGHDRLLVKAFANVIGLYPAGVLVELDSGEVAVVAAQNSDPRFGMRPRVKIVVDARGGNVEGAIVDLADTHRDGRFRRSIRRVIEIDRGKVGTVDLLSLI